MDKPTLLNNTRLHPLITIITMAMGTLTTLKGIITLTYVGVKIIGLNQSNQAQTRGINSPTNQILEIKKIMLDFIGEKKSINKRHDHRLDNLEKTQGDMSQKMDNVQQTFSRLTNTLTIQERGRFLSQP